MLLIGQFDNFVVDFVAFISEERDEKTKWEFFLHRIHDKSYNEFTNSIASGEPEEVQVEDIETTVLKSMDILESFQM